MPTYEYVCEKCGHEFELFQSISDSPLSVCPRELCGRKPWGKGPVKRKISAGAGLLFKGSGFYITDYRSEGYKTAAQKETAAAKPATTESKGGKEAKSGSETKPGGGAKPAATAKESKPTKPH